MTRPSTLKKHEPSDRNRGFSTLVASRQFEHAVRPAEDLGGEWCRDDHPPRAEYLLTPKGDELRPILRALRIWGEKHTTPPYPQSGDGVLSALQMLAFQ